MGGGDYEEGKIRNYIGNNYGWGANKFGEIVPGENNYSIGSNKFGENIEINFPQGMVHYAPVAGTSIPPPPPPPPNTEIEYYVGNNFGLAGFDFAQPYSISSVLNDNKPPSPLADQNPPRSENSINGQSPRPSTYATPAGVIETLCPACKRNWAARNTSTSNHQNLLHGKYRSS